MEMCLAMHILKLFFLVILEKWALLENSKGFIYFFFWGGICLPNLYKNINEENDMIKKIFSLVKSQNFKAPFCYIATKQL